MRLLSLALLSVLTACGVNSSSSLNSDDVSVLPETPSADPVAPGTVVDDATAAQFVGTYAVKVNINSYTTLPIFGKVTADSQLYRIAEISKVGDGLVIKDKACKAAYDSSGPLKLSVEDKVIQTLPTAEGPLRVWTTEDGVVNFAQDDITVVGGATLEDPINDALPTDARDPRILDSNRDGNPDLTAKVDAGFFASGTIYFVQRSTSSYAGKVLANGELLGAVVDNTEQSIVKASNPILKAKLGENVQNLDKSYIRLVKLPSSAAAVGCASVNFAKLFAK